MYFLCHLDDIPDNDCRGLNANGLNLIAIRHQGELYLYQNRCPHRGIGLEWTPDRFLDPDKNFIQCASHGALFRIESGLCVAGPCNGQSLTVVDYRLDGDEIWIATPTEMSPALDQHG